MKTYILLFILLLPFLSVTEGFLGQLLSDLLSDLLSGSHGNVEPKPAKPDDFPGTHCVRTCYRSYNGTCNNLKNPLWGAPGTVFKRLFDCYSYSDGKCEMPCLTSAREISMDFVHISGAEDKKHTLYMLMFGQMLAHDIALASGAPQTGAQAISCNCVNGKLKKQSSVDERCAPIKIPEWDPYFTPAGIECFDFVRTRSTCHDECSTGPGEQYNAVTSFIDLSPLYGNNDEQANNLRKFKHGMLDYVMIEGRMYPPQARNSRVCNVAGASQPLCIMTGDFRGNQNPHIALMQTVLLRLHNKIAKKLCKEINPHWCDEQCFQEARRISIAIFQHICYGEYLPLILGRQNMIKHGLIKSNPKGYVDIYDDEVDPSTINEHTTAADRSIHSMVVGFLGLFDEHRKEHGKVRLSNTFNNVSLLLNCDTELKLAIGAATQPQLLVDRLNHPEISLHLFEQKGQILGLDLFSIDVQRARDHGLCPYACSLKESGLGNPKCFEDFEFISPENLEILKRHYKSYDEVELRVAGQLETVKPGTLAGPINHYIMMQQFYNLKAGDYYWYEREQECSFTKDQLKEIRKQTMAKLMCQNAGDFPIQPRAFEVPSSNNKIGPCCDLPFIDLTKWKEEC